MRSLTGRSQGRVVKRSSAVLLFFLASFFLVPAQLWHEIELRAQAANFTVTKTDDTNDGVCDGDCSLREAITAANSMSGADTIGFNITTGTAPFVITPASALPVITEAVTIDGYTQAGAMENTLTAGNNAVIQIVLSGRGLDITGGGSTVKGLVIVNCSIGITLRTNGGNTIAGNFIGLQADGTTSGTNQVRGVDVQSASNIIGGSTPQARNIISSQDNNDSENPQGVGIDVQGSNNIVRGNYIGTDRNGTADRGNRLNAIRILNGNGDDNTIGGANSGQGNIIAFSGQSGVRVATFSGTITGNRIAGNSIFSNNSLGIDLNDDLVTNNDSCDPDTGPNNLQNFPLISAAASTGGSTNVSGILNSTASQTFTLDFYANDDCDISGNGEGKTYLGSTVVTTDAMCRTNFSATFPADLLSTQFITATATDAAGNTSEFSPCKQVNSPPQNFVDLAITKTDSPDPVFTGNNLTYTLNITNNESAAANNVVVTDNLSFSTVFDSASAGCTYSSSSHSVTCNLGTIGGGGNASANIIVIPINTSTINNTASVTTSDIDILTGNNSDDEATVVNPALTAALTGAPDPVVVGQNITYTATISNNGAATANNLTLTDNLPASVSFVSASSGCSHSGGVVTCNLGSLSGGSNKTPQIVVTANQTGSVSNRITASATNFNTVTTPFIGTTVLPAIPLTSNYVFTVAANDNLTDMTGATTLIGANQGGAVSAVSPIGFDFFFMGTPTCASVCPPSVPAQFDKFSVNSNGVLKLGATATDSFLTNPLGDGSLLPGQLPVFLAYGASQRTSLTGSVSFKTIGTAPNRVLVVEWRDMHSTSSASNPTADLTYQVRLFETTGVVEFVYGSMIQTLSSNTAQIGFMSTDTAGGIGTVAAPQPGMPAPGYNGFTTTPANNNYTIGAITVLSSANQGERRIFRFTPPMPNAPTNLTFSNVSATILTANWTENATNENGYAVYGSTDGANFRLLTAVGQNAASANITGLDPNTNYTFRVFAVSESGVSGFAQNSQSTPAPGNFSSTAAGGNWSSPATWTNNAVPTASDHVTIASAAFVTVDLATQSAFSLTINGTLEFTSVRSTTLNTRSALVSNTGIFRSRNTGTPQTHTLNITGNLMNNGVLDFSTNNNQTRVFITFNGLADATFGGSGATTDITRITIDKVGLDGNGRAVELNPTNLTVRGTASTTDFLGFFAVQRGILKISGTFGGSHLFGAVDPIQPNAELWLNNPNLSIVTNINFNTQGRIRVSTGTITIGFTLPPASATISNLTVEGGTFAASGGLSVTSYTQTGGELKIGSLVGGFLASGIFTMSGGTITLQTITSNLGVTSFNNNAAISNVTGGTLQTLSAPSGQPKDYAVSGKVFNFVVNARTDATDFHVLGNTTNGGQLTALRFRQSGATFTNNGGLSVDPDSSNPPISSFNFNGTVAQTYTGSGTAGTTAAPLSVFDISNTGGGVTIDTASPTIVTSRINLFTGRFINSNKIQLGTGGTSSAVIQRGNAAAQITPPGEFDVAPVFNVGTGGLVLIYSNAGTSIITALEIPASRIARRILFNCPQGFTLNGGDLTVSNAATAGSLELTNGIITTGANTLIVGATTAVTRTNGYVNGNLRMDYNAAGSKVFHLGTSNGYSPVTINATSGTGSFTASATQSAMGGLNPSLSLQRFWTLNSNGITQADVTVQYLDADVPSGVAEADLVFFRKEGSTITNQGISTLNQTTNTATLNNVTQFSDWTLGGPGAPTAIELILFNATSFADGTLLEWQTGLEVDNLGFNIYRDDGGRRTLVNNQLVAGSALRARPTLRSGDSYVWWDRATSKGAAYWLVDVDLKGLSTWHGPFYATQAVSKQPSARLEQAKTLAELGSGQSTSAPVESRATRGLSSSPTSDQLMLAAAPNTVKLKVKHEGWYRATQPELATAGFNTSIDPRLLQFFVDGHELPMLVQGEQDGSFDPADSIEFYGVGLDSPFTESRTYWLAAGSKPGLRIKQEKSEGAPTASHSFTATIERRDRTVYFSALRNGERENFFGAVIAFNAVDQQLMLSRLAPADSSARVEIALQGVTLAAHRVGVELNGTQIGEVIFNGQSQGTAEVIVSQSMLLEGGNIVRLTPLGGPSDVSLVDCVRISYQHSYSADNDSLKLTAGSNEQITVDGFTTKSIRVFDVTDANSPQELLAEVVQQTGGYSVTFASSGKGERVLLAFAGQPRTAVVTLNQPSTLMNANASFLIITSREFAASMMPLVAVREKQGLSAAVIDVEDIYDEFSFGQKTPLAVKDFLALANSTWKKKPRFLLFAGDASYDAKNYLGFGDLDLVPTRLIDTEFMETSSDDWFSDFDGDGVADLATGRLPARSAEELTTMVKKIIGYEGSSPADEALLVADANDGFDFEQASFDLRSLIPPGLRITHVNRGRLDPEMARRSLFEALSRRQFLVNYVGHGSVNQWRANLLTNDDARDLRNDHLPMFVMMTCLNGYFHDPALDSLGESLMKAERGGAVAVWASSGMTLPMDQALMNQQLYRQVFSSPRAMTLGDAILRAKASISDSDIRRTWILLGDPTTRLR